MTTEHAPQGSGQRTQRRQTLTGELQPREARLPKTTEPTLERQQARELADGLGWFSIALGTAQLLAPRAVCRVIGTRRDHTGLMRLMGLRELAAGFGLLSAKRQGAWLQARVAGDLLDLAFMGVTLAASPHKGRALLSTGALAGVTVLDLFGARTLGPVDGITLPAGFPRAGESEGVPVVVSTTVNQSAEEAYRFWRELTNLPRFMAHVKSVQIIDERRSHWVVIGPAGTRIEWDSEIVEDRPNEYVRWRSVPGSAVDHTGLVRFEPAAGGRGTIVRVEMVYRPPAGRAGAFVAKLLGEDPNHTVREDLRRFKRVLETGEIPTTRGQPAGQRSLFGRAARLGESYAR